MRIGTSKVFVLDTSVLLHDPDAIFRFADNSVHIPKIVFWELDKKKTTEGVVGFNSRRVARTLNEILVNITPGTRTVPINNEGGLLVFSTESSPGDSPDQQIINYASSVQVSHPDHQVIIVSKDIYLRNAAILHGVPAEDYKHASVEKPYVGTRQVTCNPGDIDALYLVEPGAGIGSKVRPGLKLASLDDNIAEQLTNLSPNECVTLIDSTNPTRHGLCKYNDKVKALQLISSHDRDFAACGIKPLNSEQKYALDLLLDPNVEFLSIVGATGSGKTLLSLAAAIHQTMYLNRYENVIVTRKQVSVGAEDIGFLPGDINEKTRPWMEAIYGCLNKIAKLDHGLKHDRMLNRACDAYLGSEEDNGPVQVKSLGFVRGVTWENSVILVDECFPEGAEILTSSGFKDFKDLQTTDQVAAYHQDGSIDWEVPSRLIEKDYDGPMSTISSPKYYSSVTENHQRVYIDPQGSLTTLEAKQSYGVAWKIPLAGTKVGGRKLTGTERLQLKLAVLLQADGNANFKRGNPYWQISVVKERKCERIKEYLNELGIIYSEYEKDRRGRTRFYIGRLENEFLLFDDNKKKIFDTEKILNLCVEDLACFLEETFFWDGYLKENESCTTYQYFSVIKHNIDCVQAVAHLLNKTARVTVTTDSRSETYSDYYKLTVSNRNTFGLRKIKPSVEYYSGKVRCCTVSTGMIVVRQNNTVTINGNCQNMHINEVKALTTRAGKGSKVIIMGDPSQIDLEVSRYLDERSNGLTVASQKMRGWSHTGHITLFKTERSELSSEAAKRL
jgi:PhoH-like ATPase